MALVYAGIGSRETPSLILERMTKVAIWLADKRYILRSGGAQGADSAFEAGCDTVSGKKEIFLPWQGFNGKKSRYSSVSSEALQLASAVHPAWNRLSDAGHKLMARNCYQILGKDLLTPADFVVCYTMDGEASGGTGQAIRLAEKYNIKCFNLFLEETPRNLYNFVNKRQSDQTP